MAPDSFPAESLFGHPPMDLTSSRKVKTRPGVEEVIPDVCSRVLPSKSLDRLCGMGIEKSLGVQAGIYASVAGD